MSYGKKDEDADLGLVKVDRTQVFQEGGTARLFNSSPIQPRRCRILLTKIALLLYTGEKFPTNEATTLFFGISKLFQNKDASLRQMVHLVIKELAHSAEDIIMVTSTIMKDTGGSTDIIYRPNAIRALCRIIDATTVQSIERVMKTAIVDKNPSVSSAALVSSYHLLPIAKDVVRRWQSETQEAAASTKSSGGFSLGFSSSSGQLPANNSTMPQYHAIGLLYSMRMHDRMALVKMVQQFGAAGAVKSSAAIVMLVRLAAQLAEEDPSLRKPMMQLLDGWLRHKSEMVNFEAAKAICDMRDVTDAEVSQAVHVLQLFLTSPRAVTKFAALRILHNFASFKPNAVNVCNPDIELLISNSNRSIATFAITTLLKTGNEASVDRLMKQITGFMSEITDEFKITIVEAIRTLCLKFPSKQAGMLAFLSGILRDEGGYEFKRAVVESMFDLIKFVPESKEDALAHLCEFIEDCEFTKLAVRILHLLGLEGPKTSQPTKYIRYIYNRVVLENAIVRAAAVTALAKFGVGQKDPEVKRSVEVLLTRCLDDVDDEVRDRAALNLRLMHEDDEISEKFVKNDSMFSLPYFEHQLVMYVTSEDKSAFDTPFDISQIPVVTREQADAEDRTKKLTATAPSLKPPKVGPTKTATSGAEAAASATAAAQRYAQELMQIPEMKEFGSVLKSSPVVELTESEMEYVVTVVKHIFKEHIVFQYEIKNTLQATVLENVSVVATPSEEEELEEVFIIQAEKLPTDEPGKVYVAFKKVGGEGSMPVSSFSNVLKFTSKEIDPTTNEPEETGYDDEYEVAEFDLAGSDYVVPTFASNFNHIWEQVGASGEEAEETLQLSSMKSIAEATEQLAKVLSLQPLEGTDVPVNQTTHTLKLLGKTVGGGRVVANVRMAYSSKSGVTTKITVRSEEEGVAALVVASVA
ncbi:coatomer subunit gamma [Colletotrichum truncatum]|uniref:Coatomer subunit gamma n=1 Tax=Colletotrichum truncatum TaxID=5467 RepID=A0ACC3Z0N8_COLTU